MSIMSVIEFKTEGITIRDARKINLGIQVINGENNFFHLKFRNERFYIQIIKTEIHEEEIFFSELKRIKKALIAANKYLEEKQ